MTAALCDMVTAENRFLGVNVSCAAKAKKLSIIVAK
jgi:hypothetical protein